MMLKAILCVQHVCSFGAMLFIADLLKKKRFLLLFVLLVCLSMFVMGHFLLKIADVEDILY